MFFATLKDLQPIIEFIETTYSIKYYKMGMFDNDVNNQILSILKIENVGKPSVGDWNKDIRFLMIPKDASLTVRSIPQKAGGIKYATDSLANQTSLCIQIGGVFKEGIIIPGTLGTTYSSTFSDEIFKTFSSKIKKEFKKIDEFYVGSEAEGKLSEGWRLVTNEKLSQEFDLKLKTK